MSAKSRRHKRRGLTRGLGKLTAAKKKKMWKWIGWSAFGVGTIAVAREAYLTFGPYRDERRTMYEAAFLKAITTKKPLIVLGDPDGGILHRLLGRDFQCGAVCIDPKGCGGCPTGVNAIMDDPTHALSLMANNSAVIFDSGLFAFTDDGYALAEQMKRVSGGDLYMHDVSPWTLTSFLEARRKRTLVSAPPSSRVIEWKTGLLSKEPRTAQRSGSVGLNGFRGLGALTYSDEGTREYPSPILHPKMTHYEQLVSRPRPFTYYEM